MYLTIPKPTHFRAELIIKFLNRNNQECLFTIHEDQVLSSVMLNGKCVPFSITFLESELKVETQTTLVEDEKDAFIKHISEWFDLNKDLSPFYDLLENNSKLNPLLAYKGLRLIGIPNLFEAMCWSVIGQQINLNFAYKLKRRLVETYGTKIKFKGHEYGQFPTPDKLLNLDDTFQKANQFSRSKVAYLRNIAEAFIAQDVSKEKLFSCTTFEEKQGLLTQIKGIGEWSANYALMKCLHEPNAIPFGDTGLTQALYNLELISDRKDRNQVERFFESVKGWESYTTFYLWYSLLK